MQLSVLSVTCLATQQQVSCMKCWTWRARMAVMWTKSHWERRDWTWIHTEPRQVRLSLWSSRICVCDISRSWWRDSVRSRGNAEVGRHSKTRTHPCPLPELWQRWLTGKTTDQQHQGLYGLHGASGGAGIPLHLASILLYDHWGVQVLAGGGALPLGCEFPTCVHRPTEEVNDTWPNASKATHRCRPTTWTWG